MPLGGQPLTGGRPDSTVLFMSGQPQDARATPPIKANLRRLMERDGATPEQVAVSIGVRDRMVRRWLSPHDVNPSWENVCRLARFFEVEPSSLYAEPQVPA